MKKLNISDLTVKTEPTEVKVASPMPQPNPSSFKEKVEHKLKNIKVWYNKLTPTQKYFMFVVLATLIAFVSSGYLYYVTTKPLYTPPYLVPKDSDYIETSSKYNPLSLFPFELASPSKPRTESSPINGILFTKEELDVLKQRAPVAVMVNNHSDARPQSSLNKADIVYESEVESGITRIMPIYWSEGVDKVGPIRSVRNYHLDWISPYDPIFIHDGYASGEDVKIDAGGNMYRYGIKTISTTGAWREFDGVRFAPHNEYSTVNGAWITGTNLGWNNFPESFTSWKFKQDSPTTGKKYGADIMFNRFINNGGQYDVEWRYNEGLNAYTRSYKNGPDIDQETGENVYAKTVIVEMTSITQTFNDKGHILIETSGSGDAKIMMDGEIINGLWKKDSRTSRTIYYDSEGKEISFNRGRIWITVIDPNQGQFDIIDQ